MISKGTPAIQALIQEFQPELVWAQVRIRRTATGFELRHLADGERAAEALRCLQLEALRSLSQFTASGAFRPLKSAPTLQSGWRLELKTEAELELALHHLYPGSVADWYAVRSGPSSVTDFRDYTGRQTGMYRITQKLSDPQAAEAISACCPARFCLKQRLWSVTGLSPDSPELKSRIPCLEPCAVMLEWARKSMRIEQQETAPLPLAPDDAASLADAVRIALDHPDPDIREGDFNAPGNPRRLQRLWLKIRHWLQTHAPKKASDDSEP